MSAFWIPGPEQVAALPRRRQRAAGRPALLSQPAAAMPQAADGGDNDVEEAGKAGGGGASPDELAGIVLGPGGGGRRRGGGAPGRGRGRSRWSGRTGRTSSTSVPAEPVSPLPSALMCCCRCVRVSAAAACHLRWSLARPFLLTATPGPCQVELLPLPAGVPEDMTVWCNGHRARFVVRTQARCLPVLATPGCPASCVPRGTSAAQRQLATPRSLLPATSVCPTLCAPVPSWAPTHAAQPAPRALRKAATRACLRRPADCGLPRPDHFGHPLRGAVRQGGGQEVEAVGVLGGARRRAAAGEASAWGRRWAGGAACVHRVRWLELGAHYHRPAWALPCPACCSSHHGRLVDVSVCPASGRRRAAGRL